MKEYDKKNPLKWPATTISGIIAVLFYVVFMLISWILFPNTATPLNHWLSDFGRNYIPAVDKPVWDPVTGLIYTGASRINPGGIFYNLGCILCGILLADFFTGFLIFKNEGKDQRNRKLIKTLTYILVILGYLAAFSLIMNGIFFEDWPGLYQINAYYSLEHSFFSKMIFISFIPIMILVGIWTYLLKFKRYITISSFLFLIVAVIVVITGNAIAIAEWIAVFTALALVIMVSLGVYLKIFS